MATLGNVILGRTTGFDPMSATGFNPIQPEATRIGNIPENYEIAADGTLMMRLPDGRLIQPNQPYSGSGSASNNRPIIDNLPALRAPVSLGERSTIDPALVPYLQTGLQAAEQQFLRTTPQFFQGQTYVSPSEQTLAALQQQEAMATAPQPTLQAGQQAFLGGLQGLQQTAQGGYTGSPYLQQQIDAATRPIQQQFEQTTLPGVASLYSRAGRYGSGAMERAVGQATESTGRALGDVASNIAFQDYAAQQQRQQAAQQALLQGATMAPQIYAQQFLPSQQLGQVGAAREAISAQPLQEQMQRFYFEQQAPVQQLQSYLSSVYGTPLGASQGFGPQPQMQGNTTMQNIGGLLNIASSVPQAVSGLQSGYRFLSSFF